MSSGSPGSHLSSRRGLWGRAHSVLLRARAVPPGPSSAAPRRHPNCPILPAAGHPLAPGHRPTLWGISKPQGPHPDLMGLPPVPGASSNPMGHPLTPAASS